MRVEWIAFTCGLFMGGIVGVASICLFIVSNRRKERDQL
jgi:hypothetical protein